MEYHNIRTLLLCIFSYFLTLIFDCCLWLLEAKPPEPTGALPWTLLGDGSPQTLYFQPWKAESWQCPWPKLDTKLFKTTEKQRVSY